MRKDLIYLLLLVLSFNLVGITPTLAQDQGDKPVAWAVMFWMDTCGHCHLVIDNVLPPLQEKYGDQFQLLLIELVSQEDVDLLYEIAASINVSVNSVNVPFMVIGDKVLIGSQQIPAELPGLIEGYLAVGGVGLPEVPGLVRLYPSLFEAQEDNDVSEPLDETKPEDDTAGTIPAGPIIPGQPSTGQPIQSGFTLAIVVLASMATALVFTIIRVVQTARGATATQIPAFLDLLTPILALIGLGVAGYLAYVETTAVQAVCGPVGDCNAVQSSPYAKIFGVLPVGLLGFAGYLGILIAWVWSKKASRQLADYAGLIIFTIGFAGTIYSLYLTYLEPFVIKAVCAWCLSSAVIITALMLVNIPAVQKFISVEGD
jgi:uncharacterized membrane protein